MEIRIKDTGKYSVGGLLLAGEKRAFGTDNTAGSELTLKNAKLGFGLTTLVNDSAVPGKKFNDTSTEAYNFSESDKNGIENPQWVLSVVFDRQTTNDMITFGRLVYMCQTKGYKEVYSSTGNGFNDMIAYSKYGKREADGESTKTVSFINVRIKSITAQQTSDRKHLRCSLTLTETT